MKGRSEMPVEFLVQSENPQLLDLTARQLGAALEEQGGVKGAYVRDGDGYVVRCFGDPDYFAFVLTAKGYGKILKRREIGGEWQAP